jgi:putative SOS response-associated peptidase YedK
MGEDEQVKLPWLYEVDSGKPFAFAGLWETWRPGGMTVRSESCHYHDRCQQAGQSGPQPDAGHPRRG